MTDAGGAAGKAKLAAVAVLVAAGLIILAVSTGPGRRGRARAGTEAAGAGGERSVAVSPGVDGGAGGAAVLASPETIGPGDRFRVLAAFETEPKKVRVSASGPGGSLEPLRTRRGGGPPFWWAVEFRAAGGPGRYEVSVERDGMGAGGAELDAVERGKGVAGGGPGAGRAVPAGGKGWTRESENLYSAWLEALFLEDDERGSWDALHEVLRDPARNVLYDHLGLGEDEAGGRNAVDMVPDCADNPYFLRAYFAWKLGLPFGYFETSWGTVEAAPRGLRWFGSAGLDGAGDRVGAFRRLLPRLMNVIHAGNGRTAFRSDDSDYYPLPLTRRDLRPGAVYADPYGHTLTIVRWVRQTSKRPGLLLAVDAQPDGTIGIKRFWRGNFLFATEEVVGEPGFKAFRPIVLEEGRPRLLANEEIRRSPDYGNYSLEQERMAPEAFYDRMERLINSDPLDAESALRDLFRALHEQLLVRVESVANGDAFMRAHPGTVIPMPAGGAAVFQTTGDWENYSTPNRDLRLLIAIDTLLGFPGKAAADAGAFRMAGRKSPEAVRAGLVELQNQLARETTISYVGSDGSGRTLTLADIFAREEAFEMAYNPNDGPEIRWGAPEGSAERAACRRRAPAFQVERMKAMRKWFRKRLHPAT